MDFLAYRFPGQEQVLASGTFHRLQTLQDVGEQFIVSDFAQQTYYAFEAFEPMQGEPRYQFPEITPYIIGEEDYLQQAGAFLEALREQDLGKAVFSRVKEVSYDASTLLGFFTALCEIYPKALIHLSSSAEFGTWIGASPEILLQVDKQRLHTMSLAGTRFNVAADVAWGEKEIEEQALVSEFIEATLHKHHVQDIDRSEPMTVDAGPVAHLRSDFSGSTRGVDMCKLIEELHPTPAVSGLPREAALAIIRKYESHDRSLYAGLIGWIGKEKIALYVNLRCAQMSAQSAFLYLGGGFTQDSVVKDEWQETENKSQTLIQVMEELRKNKKI